MAYPKKPKQENTNAENIALAPVAPVSASASAPQVGGVRGGAPRINRRPWQHDTGTRIPVASPLSLDESQKYLADLQTNVKQMFDEKFKALGEADAASRFWQSYQRYPNEMATLIARRIFTDKMVAAGPVAEYMKWLKDIGR